MSELSPEGAVAGRLEVIVEAALRGFAADLKRKVEEASKNVKAKIGVELDADGLREVLQAKVDEAAAGVTATIGIDFDAASLKAKVTAAAEAASTDVNIGADTKGITPEVAAAVAAAKATSGEVDVDVQAKQGSLLLSTIKEKIKTQLAMLRQPITVPVKADTRGVQREGLRLRGLIRGGLVLGIVSLIQPLLGAISQLVSGLTAMVAAAGPALNTLSAFPIGIAAFVQAMVAGKIAMQGFSSAMQLLSKQQKGPLSPAEAQRLKQAMSELSPSAGLFAKRIVGLRDEWVKMRKRVQEPLFKPLAKEIRPLAKELLPVLEKGLRGTTTVFGRWVTSASAFLRSGPVKSDLGRVFRSNNLLISDFGDAVGDVSAGMLDFLVASRPFARRIGDVAKGFGDWFRLKAKNGRDSGSTQEFLDRAGDRLGLIWRLTKNVAGGFKGIFKAADGTGLGLLTDFNRFLKRWNEWANGPDGQKRMTEFFKNTEPGFRELARIVHDMGIGWLKMGEDPGIVKLLEKIRTDIGPALSKFLTEMAHNSAPAVVDALGAILNMLAELAPVTKGVAEGFKFVADAVALLAAGIGKLGPLGDTILKITGFVLAYRLMTKLPLVGGLASSIGSIVTSSLGLNPATGRVTMFTRAMAGLRIGLAGLAIAGGQQLTSMVKGTSDASNAWRTLIGAASGAAAGFLVGGPVGLALGAGAGGLLALKSATDRSKEAFDREREAIRQQIRALADYQAALAASRGKVDQGVRTQISDQITKQAPEATGAAKSVGLSKSDLVDAVAGKKTALDLLANAYKAAAKSGATFTNSLGEQEKVTDGLANFFEAQDNGVPALVRNFKNQRFEFDANTRALTTWRKQLAGLSPDIVRAVGSIKTLNSKTGKVFNGAQLKDLANQFSLGPAQIKQIAHAMTPDKDAQRALLAAYRTSPGEKSINDAAQARMDALLREQGKITARSRQLAKLNPGQALKGLQKSAQAALSQVTTGFGIFGGGGKSAAPKASTSSLVAPFKKAIQQTIQVISEGKGPIKTASSANVAAAAAPLKGVRGKFSTYGQNITQGLADGMSGSALDNVRAAAAALIAEAEKVIRIRGEIRSPSRLMKRLGRYVSQGFEQGILGGVAQVNAATNKLFSLLRQAGKKGIAKELHKRLDDDLDKIAKYAKKRADLTRRIEAGQAKLDDLLGKKSSLIDTVKQSGEDLSSVSSIASANGGFLTPGFLVGQLQRRLAQAKQFAADLVLLRQKGFGEPTVRQIASEGITNGLAIAKQLLSSTPDQVSQINSLQNQITSVADSTANQTANALYNAGIQAAQGLVKGLTSQEKELEKVAKKLAHTIVKTIKSELKIKSPSRITQAIGAFTTDGLTKGLGLRRPRLLREARRMSRDLVDELRTTAPSVSSGQAIYNRFASATGSAVPAPAVPFSGGPLVEHLELKAGTADDVREVLDEAMHTLRKIRNGGIHAERVA